MSQFAGTGIGVKLAVPLLTMLAVFSVLGYSVVSVSADCYVASVQVRDNAPFGATVYSATVQATLTNGTELFNATATGLPVVIPSHQSRTIAFDIYAVPGLSALSNATLIDVYGHVQFSVGFIRTSIPVSQVFTAAQLRQALYLAGRLG